MKPNLVFLIIIFLANQNSLLVKPNPPTSQLLINFEYSWKLEPYAPTKFKNLAKTKT